MKNGIISYGEAFIDYIAQDTSNNDFQPYLGGTTINVAVGAQRLGTPTYYLCKMGTDDDSHFIKTALRHEQVNQDYCIIDNLKSICTVHIHLNKKGERYFHAYVDDSPDQQLLREELNEVLFKTASIFYCGSGTLFHPIANQTTMAAIQLARKQNTLVAFDPNIRIKRWESEEKCRTAINSILLHVNILKISKTELLFLMEKPTLEEGLRKLTTYRIPYVWVTLGEKGAIVVHREKMSHVEGKKVQAIDTTGSGDAFMAGILHCIHENGVPVNERELISYTEFANELGASVATRLGALTF